MISDEMVDDAITWMTSNGEAAGVAASTVARREADLKRIKAEVFLECRGTVAERQAKVETAERVIDAHERHADAVRVLAELRWRRESYATLIDAWRTYNANNRDIRRVG